MLFFLLKFLEAYAGELLVPGAIIGFLFLGLASRKLFGPDVLPYYAAASAINTALFSLENSSTLYLQFCFLFFSFYFLWGERGKLLHPGSPLQARLFDSLLLFLVLLSASLILASVSNMLGVGDEEKVAQTVEALPLYLLIFSFTIAPVTEELFFRAFLVSRAGPIIATLLFAAVHHAYGSISEIAGALFLGLILSYYFYWKKDVLPCILAHAAFNFLSVFFIKVIAG